MVSILTRAPTGFPGSVSRPYDGQRIQPELVNTSLPPTAFGQFVKYNAGSITPLASGDAGSLAVGATVRAYPTQSNTNAFGQATPPTSGFLDTMKTGYMTVALTDGTAAKGGQVYVVTTAGGTHAVGDIVTSTTPALGGTAVAITGAFFEGPAGADGVVEIFMNIVSA